MAKKSCPQQNCGKKVGPRTKKCECGYIFIKDLKPISQNSSKKRHVKLKPKIKTKRLNDWRSLQNGDTIYVVGGGLYSLKRDFANAIFEESIGYRGKFNVCKVTEQGLLVNGNKNEGELSYCFLDMVTEKEDDITSFRPYVINVSESHIIKQEELCTSQS